MFRSFSSETNRIWSENGRWRKKVRRETSSIDRRMDDCHCSCFLAARHAAFKYDCKFVETSAAINDKVDDLLAGTLKQIRISEHLRNEQRRRLTVANGSVDTNDSETAILPSPSSRKASTVYNRNSKGLFAKFLNVFRKKPSRLPADVENLNTGVRWKRKRSYRSVRVYVYILSERERDEASVLGIFLLFLFVNCVDGKRMTRLLSCCCCLTAFLYE